MAKRIPGPSDVYALPTLVGYDNHDVRKQRMPSYSFSSRSLLKDRPAGPGPGRYNLGNLVRYGVVTPSKFSMASRTFLTDKSKSPGPQTYNVHNAPIFKGSIPPAYSMGRPNTYLFKVSGPSPNRYGAKDIFVKVGTPSYTMGVKTFLKTQQVSPGPARYANVDSDLFKNKSPKYTMVPRNQFVYKFTGPGPNLYNRSLYEPFKKAPTYSFGLRHSNRSGVMIVACDNI